MVVTCPNCTVRLKVDEAKLKSEISRFKCPKCSAVLTVKKPAIKEETKKVLDEKKIIVAHSNSKVLGRAVSILRDSGYDVITASDGIDVMIKALKETPLITIVEVALPKIYGFEICKRLKMRPETRGMKFILIPSIYDKTKYRREPVSLYDADDYIEDSDIEAHLMEKINRMRGFAEEKRSAHPSVTEPGAAEAAPPKPPIGVPEPAMAATPARPDEKIEKARRLARTIINDIYLYNAAKVDESIRNDNFYAVFAPEVREGKKLYDNRIPAEVRSAGDFYREEIEIFLAKKKKSIS